MWVPSARVLEAAVIGVPASTEEVRRYRERAKKIIAVSAKTVDSRSFVQVASERVMENRGGGRVNFHGGRKDECKEIGREEHFRNHVREGEFGRQGEHFNQSLNNFRSEQRRDGGGRGDY